MWNETDHPRLVLILDLWHHKLDSDEKREAAMDTERAARYRRIVRERRFEPVPGSSEPAPTSSESEGQQRQPVGQRA